MSFKGSTLVPKSFSEGKARKRGVNQSTGSELFYHGNKIAEWKDGKLFISNGGYQPVSRRTGRASTGSMTTKDKLNALPGVRIDQKDYQWYLNGKLWDGSWIEVKTGLFYSDKKGLMVKRKIKAPEIDLSKVGEAFDLSTKYVATDGWRGYNQPEFAVAGANDTGMHEDSPCRSDVAEKELKSVISLLNAEGIKTMIKIEATSNVFCVHHYIVPFKKHVAKARELVKNFLETTETRLLYIVE